MRYLESIRGAKREVYGACVQARDRLRATVWRARRGFALQVLHLLILLRLLLDRILYRVTPLLYPSSFEVTLYTLPLRHKFNLWYGFWLCTCNICGPMLHCGHPYMDISVLGSLLHF